VYASPEGEDAIKGGGRGGRGGASIHEEGN
jgi:hypothetical protein